jgi:hypothetical protein
MELRHAVLHKKASDIDEECRLTDDDIYPEILFFVYRVIAKYMDMIKREVSSNRLIYLDMADWLNKLKELLPELFLERPEDSNPYYQIYFSRDNKNQ